MISATVILVLMIVALLISMMGIVFAFTSIILNYTGRSKSYDRAAIKMSKANDPKPAKSKKRSLVLEFCRPQLLRFKGFDSFSCRKLL